MTEIATLSVPIEADTAALDAALRRIQDQLSRLGAGGGDPIGEPFRKSIPTVRDAEGATLRFALARSRLLAQGGDLAGAERLIADSLRGTTASTVQTVNAQTRLLAIQQKIAAQGQGGGLTQALGNLAGTGTKIDGLIGTVGALGPALGVATAGFAALSTAAASVEFARAGAAIDAARQSFDSLAASAGTSGDALLKSLQQAAAGTVANTDIIKSSNTALLLLGSDVATKLPQLLAVAKASATTLGTDVGQVFDSLVTGISRGSTELIDNAGITVKAAEAYAAYAEQIGTSADALDSSQKQQAILNAVLTAGQDIIARTAGGTETAAAIFQRADASLANLTASAQVAAANIGAPLAGAFATAATGADVFIRAATGQGTVITQQAAQVAATATSYDAYTASIARSNAVADAQIERVRAIAPLFGPLAGVVTGLGEAYLRTAGQTGALSETQVAYVQALTATGVAQEQAVQQATAQAGALQTIEAALEGSGGALAAYAEQAIAIAATNDESRQAVENLSKAFLAGSIGPEQYAATLLAIDGTARFAAEAQAELNRELQRGAGASQEATGAAYGQALANLEQAAAAEQAAGRQSDLEQAIRNAAAGSGDAEAAAAAIAAKFNGVEAPAVANLITLYRQLASAKATAASGAAVRASVADQRAAERNLGNTKSLAGGRAAEVERLQSQALRFEQQLARQQAKATRGGGGGAAGGGKSDATKAADTQAREAQQLNEKLLSIQARFQDQSVEAERDYQERILQISQDYAAKRAEAEESFADDQVATRASFYRSLRSIEDQGARQALAAQFEQEQQKAAQIASEQGADVAQQYLQAITQILQDRAKRQAEIAQAIEDGNAGDAEFLRGLDALDRAVEDRKVADILAGKDSLQSQEAGALDEAAAQRQEALAQAQLSVQDSLAEAERKKADAASVTNEQLAAQLAIVQRIAQAGGAGAAAPAAQPAQGGAAPAAASGGGIVAAPGGGPVEVMSPDVVAAVRDLATALRRQSPNYGPGA